MNLEQDAEDHEGRRTAAAVGGSAVIGVAAILGMVWLFGILGNGPGSGASAVAALPSASSAVKAAATTAAAVKASPSSTASPTSASPTSVSPTSTLSLPPPELPTYTLSAPSSTSSTLDPPAQVTPPARVDPPQPGGGTVAGPVVSGARLSCVSVGKAVKATLTFTTTAPVPVWLNGGGRIDQETSGTGAVSFSVSGRRAGYCMATVAGQRMGPITPS